MLGRFLSLQTWQILTLVFTGFLVIFALSGKLLVLGSDNDDVMRLVQIRDFLAGQGWYDHTQYRMGGGTVMHWSRVIDLPIIGLILLFDLFLPRAAAELWAVSIWPIITGLGLIIGLRLLVTGEPRDDLKPAMRVLGLLILSLVLLSFYMFAPGRIDHHNVQLVAITLAFIGLSAPDYAPKRFALAGCMTGLSFVIGTEALPLLAVNCGFVACLWAYQGAASAKGTRMFTLGFAGVALAGFLIDTPPAAYGQIYCDVLAVNYLALIVCGCAGLAALTYMRGLSSLRLRLMALAALGAVCAGALLLLSPQCLTNPLGQLPENAQLYWLDHVEEAQPLLSSRGLKDGAFLYFIGFSIFAALMSLWRYKKLGFTPARLYGLVFIGAIIVLVFYQLRYFPFGLVIASFMLIPWTAETFVDGKAKSEGSVAYIFALALSCGSLWLFPSTLLGGNDNVQGAVSSVSASNSQPKPNVSAAQDDKKDNKKDDVCFPDKLKAYLNGAPLGMVLSEPNLTSPVLRYTEQHALNGNYHRNAAGIDQAVKIFLQTPEKAFETMRAADVKYIIYCADRPAYKIYARAGENGLAAHMIDGGLPAPFIEVREASNKDVRVWRLP